MDQWSGKVFGLLDVGIPEVRQDILVNPCLVPTIPPYLSDYLPFP